MKWPRHRIKTTTRRQLADRGRRLRRAIDGSETVSSRGRARQGRRERTDGKISIEG